VRFWPSAQLSFRYSRLRIASRRAEFAPLSPFHWSADFPESPSSCSLHDGHRFANPGLPGFSSNSSPHTTQVLTGYVGIVLLFYRVRGGYCFPKTKRGRAAKWRAGGAKFPFYHSIQKILPIQRIPLRRTEPRIANNPSQLFFGRAVGHARRPHNVFLEHDGTHIIAAEPQPHLADL
jgi:hypothetical protein